MFQHFGNRLKRDLKQIVDRRLDANATASGSQLRVCRTTPCVHPCRADPFAPLAVIRRRGRCYLAQAPTVRLSPPLRCCAAPD